MRSFIRNKYLPPYIIKWIGLVMRVSLSLSTTIGTIGLPRLARALLTLIGSCRICYVFLIKAGRFRKRYRSCNRFARKKVVLSLMFFKTLLQTCKSNRQPLLTEDRASSLPGQFCPFHLRSTLELVEKAQGFCYVYCPEKMCFMFAPASE